MSTHGKPNEVLILHGGAALHLSVTAAEGVSQPLYLHGITNYEEQVLMAT